MYNDNLSNKYLSECIEGYLKGEMNASSFTLSIILHHIAEEEKCFSLRPIIALIFTYISKKHFSPKEEQKTKNILNDVIKELNNLEIKADAERSKIIDDCEEKLNKILIIVMDE